MLLLVASNLFLLLLSILNFDFIFASFSWYDAVTKDSTLCVCAYDWCWNEEKLSKIITLDDRFNYSHIFNVFLLDLIWFW